MSRLGLFSEQETGLLAACGAYATVSDSVSLRPCPRQLGGAEPARQLAAQSRSPSSCAGEPAPSSARQGLAQSWLQHAGIAVPMVTAARVQPRSQERDSHDEQASATADNNTVSKEKDWDPLHRKYKKIQTTECTRRSLITP